MLVFQGGTPPKFNMEPENHGFSKKDFPFPWTYLQVNHVKSTPHNAFVLRAPGYLVYTGDYTTQLYVYIYIWIANVKVPIKQPV